MTTAIRLLPDLRLEDHGTICLLRGVTEQGREWLEEHVSFEQFWAGAGVVEPRYACDILAGAVNDGLLVATV